MSEVVVRPEVRADYPAIRQVNEAAFGTSEEATLVDQLREDGMTLLSLVATLNDQIVGHILFSRMSIDSPQGDLIPAVALAPMAVLSEFQRQGIGGQLIRQGLDGLRDLGERIVIVVGHPTYYPRFGFSAVQAQALEHPFPAEAFMALGLVPGALNGVRGRVRYPAAFGIE